MKIIFLPILFMLYFSLEVCKGQSDYEQWNKVYTEVDIDQYITSSTQYADSVKQLEKNNYYMVVTPTRRRFVVKNLDIKKSISSDTLDFIKKIYKFQNGNETAINTYYQKECLFETGNGLHIWIPILNTLESDFKKEVKKNKDVLLYCTVFIELTYDGKYYLVFIMNDFLAQ